jgi:NhaD family Na+/H+ antiporter
MSIAIRKFLLSVFGLIVLLLPVTAHAEELMEERLNLTHHFVGYAALFVLALAYFLVVLEEQIHLHKSKPVLLAAGIIWVLIAIVYQMHGIDTAAEVALRHSFLEYSELFFFLLVAMSYINALIDRRVFDALRYWLVKKGFSYRALFWITGILAFCISPVADNLTTALIMCTVVMTMGSDQPKFVAIACVNIVVAANAGGAFSPFGDITTLMVWQKGIIEFFSFFQLFIPAVVNFVVPTICMHFSIPKGKPKTPDGKVVEIAQGGLAIAGLFLLTILTAVCFHSFLHLPPAIGMLTGLGYLKFFSYYQNTLYRREQETASGEIDDGKPHAEPIDVFKHIADAEWDTLFFFYGVIMAVGGLGFIGYLSLASEFIYGEMGATTANILVGIISAVIDNIPIMYAVLTMKPDMPEVQWLLVTLTAGVGGSLLSVGSAAGVALMGQARGFYTFFSHLKWLPAIALGYFASIYVHFLING